jgi:hypothetical protein
MEWRAMDQTVASGDNGALRLLMQTLLRLLLKVIVLSVFNCHLRYD